MEGSNGNACDYAIQVNFGLACHEQAKRVGLATRSYEHNESVGWWAVLDLNQWLLPCEDSTLPLS
jgi:hypothetical protein